MSFQLSRKLTGSQHLCKVSAPGQVPSTRQDPISLSSLAGSGVRLWVTWSTDTRTEERSGADVAGLVCPGWLRRRLEDDHSNSRSVDLKLAVQARLHIYVGGRGPGRPTNGSERPELWGLRRVSRSRVRPELALAWSVLAHFYKPCLGLLTSLTSLTASTQTICPQTWLLLLFQAFTTSPIDPS